MEQKMVSIEDALAFSNDLICMEQFAQAEAIANQVLQIAPENHKAVAILNTLDAMRNGVYEASLKNGLVYFGKVHAAKQSWDIRTQHMEALLTRECARHLGEEFNFLEVGSWAGGSAILWANTLKKCGKRNAKVICVDAWTDYINLDYNANSVHRAMKSAFEDDGIFRLFNHNIRCSGNADMVLPFRGKSCDLMKMFSPGYFDTVYVDGDHTYQACHQDILDGMKLVKEGGILCGDDLELQYHEVDEAYLRQVAQEHDCVMDPKTQSFYHPGVALAVWDAFHQPVTAKDGFWAMRKSGGAFVPVNSTDW